MKNKVLVNLFIIAVIGTVWAGIHLHTSQSRYEKIKIYRFYDPLRYSDTEKAMMVTLPIQPGDYLKVDWKAYEKEQPKRGDVIVYYNLTERYQDGKPGYEIGKVVAFPNEEVDLYYGQDGQPYISEVRQGSGNISDFLDEIPRGDGKTMLRAPANTANNHIKFIVLNFLNVKRIPFFDSLGIAHVFGKVLSVTAPSEHKKDIISENMVRPM